MLDRDRPRPTEKNSVMTDDRRDPGSPRVSRTNSEIDLDYRPEVKTLSHNDFKKRVLARDERCLFCWYNVNPHSCHIIAQKNFFIEQEILLTLERACMS